MATALVAGRADVLADSVYQRAHDFSDLSQYSLVERAAIQAGELSVFALMKAIGPTFKFEVEGWEHWEAAGRGGHAPIYTFWHDSIILSTYFWRQRGIVVMTSQSIHGDAIARLIQRFGYGAARGSTSKGGAGAIIEMIRLMRKGHPAAFTIDGPKGPRHVAKMGAVLLAKKSGNPMLPFTVTPSRSWSLKSWDSFAIPKPFTSARVEIGEPIYVAPDADEAEMESRRCELQEALIELNRRGEEWRGRVRKPR
jgi:lysophospholipid acyltransferase (LPLAT)-like uncharacterized protein